MNLKLENQVNKNSNKGQFYDTLYQPDFKLSRAVLTEIEFENGTKSQMITLFNRDVWYEEAVIGVKKGLLHQNNVKSCLIQMGSICSGVFKPFTQYERVYFTDQERKKMLDDILQKYTS